MLAPIIVQMERQIDREIAADQKKLGVNFNEGLNNQNGIDEDSDSDIEEEETVLMYGPMPQIITNDLKSLDEMVSEDLSADYYMKQKLHRKINLGKFDTKFGANWWMK